MATPNQQKKASLKDAANTPEIQPVVELKLPSGLKAKCVRAKGKHVLEAQRIMGENPENMIVALISICTTIEGIKEPIEYYLEADAGDLMTLMGHFGPAFM